EAVEPVAHVLPTGLELRRAGAQQGALEPGGQLAAQRQLIDGRLPRERREAQRRPGGGRARRGEGSGAHGHDGTSCMVRDERYEPCATLAGMSSTRLTETSYVVLGLLQQFQPATPYDLKRVAQVSTVNFWNVPHTQLYSECARLAGAGLLAEEREREGRRRRI